MNEKREKHHVTPGRAVWWAGYLTAGIILQKYFPGYDLLAPGFLLALQLRNKALTVWLFCIFILIQEGAGSLNFGMGVLWYGGMIFMFNLSARLFVADNILFVTMLSLSLGTYLIILLGLMGAILDLPVDLFSLVRQGVVQAVILPLVWGIAYLLYPKKVRHAH